MSTTEGSGANDDEAAKYHGDYTTRKVFFGIPRDYFDWDKDQKKEWFIRMVWPKLKNLPRSSQSG